MILKKLCDYQKHKVKPCVSTQTGNFNFAKTGNFNFCLTLEKILIAINMPDSYNYVR